MQQQLVLSNDSIFDQSREKRVALAIKEVQVKKISKRDKLIEGYF